MAALDFPANPTVGQQYAAPNGITYQWDGAAWVVTGGPPSTPTGPAGGDLAGSTYPNPTIAAGAVTWPKLSLQSYARVSRGASFSIPNGANTVLVFDTVANNVGGIYSTGSPDRFTIQQTGVYLVGGHITYPNTAGGSRRDVWIWITPATFIANGSGPAGTYTSISLSTIAQLNAGSVLQLVAFQDTGGAVSVPVSSFTPPTFWIARVA